MVVMVMAMWTDEQRAAIEHEGSDLLLSAAAGSGKTSVLVERVMDLITTRKVDIDQLLVVTFTDAAARELRQRIAARLAASDDVRLKRQLALVSTADISTVHGFCLGIIRERFFDLGLAPGFSVLDDMESKVCCHQIMSKVIARGIGEERDCFELALWFRDTQRGSLVQTLVTLYELASSQVDPDGWLDLVTDMYGKFSIDDSTWVDTLLTSISWQLIGCRSLAEQCSYIVSTDGPCAYIDAINSDLERIERLYELCVEGMWTKAAAFYRDSNWQRLGRAKKDDDKDAAERCKGLRDQMKKQFDKACRLFKFDEDQLCRDVKIAGRYASAIVSLVREFEGRYERYKRERGKVDFSDIERCCYQLLTSERAGEIKSRYRYVLVDEYQDTSPIQDAIFDQMSTGDDQQLFVVGDVLQSIYRFRLAESAVFTDRRSAYEQGKGDVIELQQNFRSRQTIINGLNFVFGQLLAEPGKLVCGADYPPLVDDDEQPIELLVVERLGGSDEWGEMDPLEREVSIIGSKINELIADKTQIWDRERGEYRGVEYKDIVLLTRTKQRKAEVCVAMLEQMNIPAYADARTGLLDAHEVSVLLSMLQICDNPHQDIHVAAVLRWLYGVGMGELVDVDRRAGLYNGVCRKAESDGSLAEFIDDLEFFRDQAMRLPVSELIWLVLTKKHYYDYVGGLPGGSVRKANLRAFADRACAFEKSGQSGLGRFLQFIDDLIDAGADLGQASTLGEGDNVVRVMSVHESKGREFPFVFFLDLGQRIDRHSDGGIVAQRQLGIGVYAADMEAGVAYPSLSYEAVRQAEAVDQRLEEIRVLYVGMTRAKERLYLVGSVRGIDDQWEQWLDAIDTDQWFVGEHWLMAANTYLDLLVPVFMRHQSVGGGSGEVAQYDCQIKVSKVTEALADGDVGESDDEADDIDVDIDVDGKLRWKRDVTGWDQIPAKVAASELKRRSDRGHDDSGRWERISGYYTWARSEHTGTADDNRTKGLAIHRFLQHVDVSEGSDRDRLMMQIENMVADEVLTTEQSDLLDVDSLVQLLTGQVGVLLRSARLMREVPFTMAVLPELVSPEVRPGGPPVMVQGVIDCLVETDEGMCVIDYKLSEPGTEKQKKAYHDQISIYCQAVEKLGYKVAKAYLVYVSTATIEEVDRKDDQG